MHDILNSHDIHRQVLCASSLSNMIVVVSPPWATAPLPVVASSGDTPSQAHLCPQCHLLLHPHHIPCSTMTVLPLLRAAYLHPVFVKMFGFFVADIEWYHRRGTLGSDGLPLAKSVHHSLLGRSICSLTAYSSSTTTSPYFPHYSL